MLISLQNSQSRLVIQASILQLENEYDLPDYPACLMKLFGNYVLPYLFGLDSLTRDNFIQDHTTNMTKKLF